MKSKVGAIIFLLILFLVAFGIVSLSAEYFFGKPFIQVIQDVLFMLNRKQ
jgi:hypothetical protein